MERTYFVYIVASRKRGTVYTGVTNDLVRRTHEHREGLVPGFTKQHSCKRLVWFETHEDIEAAILREKQVKGWRRVWKDELIEASNPDWRDLWWEIIARSREGAVVHGAASTLGVIPAKAGPSWDAATTSGGAWGHLRMGPGSRPG